MDKAFANFTWKDRPVLETALAAANLNKVNTGLNTVDDRVIVLDANKANQSDLLQSLKTVTYNATTGVFVFTYWNNNTLTVDLNIEKIPVSFSMSPQGVITMTTADGTTYTADVGDLIKTYTFNNSTDIQFNVSVDSSGNKTVTANIVNGSVTANKLQPNYLADITVQAQNASASANSALSSANNANADALLSQSYAVGNTGVRQGEDTDNAKYYKEQAKNYADSAAAIVGIGIATTSQAGIVKPDGETVSVTNDGTITAIGIPDAQWTVIQNRLTL